MSQTVLIRTVSASEFAIDSTAHQAKLCGHIKGSKIGLHGTAGKLGLS
jgi:hypothetical protein